MCGICGYIRNDAAIDGSIVEKMNDRLTHRGPDFGVHGFPMIDKPDWGIAGYPLLMLMQGRISLF